ncbi:MAG: RIO1 family regulatory kinase/ATPase [Anaerolineae bacterium]
MNKNEWRERFEDFEFVDRSRRAHRNRLRQNKRRRKQSEKQEQLAAELAAIDDSIGSFVPSYAAALDPLHHERQWVINSVASFYRDKLISDVTRLVKGGKEANVYCCDGHPATGLKLLAAKLYRPRMLRHLKNDAVYKAGRQLRDQEGKQMKGRRVKLALRKKTRFGKRVDIQWWIGNEFRAQQQLYQAGADVPRPVAHSGTSILMEYIGDETTAAPTLNQVSLEPAEARAAFQRVMDNIALMLDHHLVHGDLSAYNILYWHDRLFIIDFPQMVEARTNSNAFILLQRDIRRVCDYFSRFGVETNPTRLTLDLWKPYMGRDD